MREGVGEDSRHRIVYVDIQVGSCIFGLGDFYYWALLTLSKDHYFRYRKCTGGRRLLEAAFYKKARLWLWYSFFRTCIKTLNFDICFG